MENNFDLLEEKVKKAADLVRKLRKENGTLEQEVGRIKGELKEAERQLHTLQKEKGGAAQANAKLDALSKEVDDYKREREEVRNRIGKLVEVLESLED